MIQRRYNIDYVHREFTVMKSFTSPGDFDIVVHEPNQAAVVVFTSNSKDHALGVARKLNQVLRDSERVD